MRFQFEGQSLRLTSSLGIAVYPDHADTSEELIARADTSLYQAKEAGKNAWRIYRSDIDTSQQMVSRLSWNDRILHALESGLMHLQFQGVYTAQRSGASAASACSVGRCSPTSATAAHRAISSRANAWPRPPQAPVSTAFWNEAVMDMCCSRGYGFAA